MWFAEQCAQNVSFLNSILWSDECHFTKNGVFNRHNCHYWASENPHLTKPKNFQKRFGFNVWAGIINDRLIGPYIFESNLNSNLYLEILQKFLENEMDDLPLNIVRNIMFQQDGAPCHNSHVVANCIFSKY